MSDREFDNYLALVSSLLRLSPRQRSAVASELRSHLEDRLEELTAEGIAHDEAVRQALAEFGDAAGLAGQFGAISHEKRRRWLMRMTTFSICATLLMAAGLAIFWPGRNAAPGVGAVAAQAPRADDPFAAPARPGTDSGRNQAPARSEKAAARDQIEAALGKPTQLEVTEMPLKDVVLFLQETNKIPIYLRKKKLEEAGIFSDHPISLSLHGVPLSTALDIFLGELELTYVVDDLLIITTPEDAESHLETRVYDCRDLLAMPAPIVPAAAVRPAPPAAESPAPVVPQPAFGAEMPGANTGGTAASARGGGGFGRADQRPRLPQTEGERRTEQLIQLTQATIAPDSWADVGGPGAIDAYNGLIVVSQTYAVHRQVERLYDMLREAAGLEVPPNGRVVR